MLNKMIIKYYYSLNEVANELGTDYYPFEAMNDEWTWSRILGVDFVDDIYTQTLLRDYIWPAYGNEIIGDIELDYDEEPEDADIKSDFNRKHVGAIYKWLKGSYDRYSQIIGLYEKNKANLLKAISTTTTTRFNDTPQDGGSFANDEHTSNISEMETNMDGNTLMSRLQEVNRKLESYYESWAEEFRHFIY